MQIRKMLVAVLSLALLFAAGIARASSPGYGYFLASFGETDSEFSVTPNDTIQGDDSSFEIGFGYAFNDYLAIEGSYQDFGEPDGFVGCPPDVFCIAIVPLSREPVEINGWSAALRGSVPFTDILSGFVRAGFLAWDASASSPSLNDSGTDFLYGAGLSADFTDRFGLQVSFEQVESDFETLKVGIRYRF